MANTNTHTHTDTDTETKHIAVCPSAGIGHLAPFLRLASMLSTSTHHKVTLINILPTLSEAETTQINSFLSSHPHITSSPFSLPSNQPENPSHPSITDPFFRQYQSISTSSHLLSTHIVSLSPTPSIVFSDLMLASGLNSALSQHGVECYTVITTSARFFSVMLTRSRGGFVRGEEARIPGLSGIPADEMPPLMYDSNHVLSRNMDVNCKCLKDAKGVVLNTFEFFEKEAVLALGSGQVWSDLPPVFAIGPLHPLGSNKGPNSVSSWLDAQPSKSVVFVSFGSRTAMSKDQIKEIGEGLEISGMRFLWVIKTAVVDKEDKEDLVELLGEAFFERTKDRGLIVKEWVNQEEILSHPATGGFVTHCGWNSVMEAAHLGLPLLAWPLHGDQRINAGVVKAIGLGIWERGWVGERLVKATEVGDRIKELMTSQSLRNSASRVGEEAKKAWEKEGSSSQRFNTILGI